MKDKELIVYRNFGEDENRLLSDMTYLYEHYYSKSEDIKTLSDLFYSCTYRLIDIAGKCGFYGNLWHCFLTYLLVNNENAYSTGCEMTGYIDGSINDAVLHDMKIFKEMFEYPLEQMAGALKVDCVNLITLYQSSERDALIYAPKTKGRICRLARTLAKESTASAIKDSLTVFYKDIGVGKFGLHKAFRIECDENPESAEIVPISNIAEVRLNDLVGYEDAKEKLTQNTEAFVLGKRANNCLLYGDAGTGKSTSIKAIANEYYDKGLRVIEVYKHQFRAINSIISQIKNRNYKFIIYMDDLSFEEFETEYKYLKAVIEGGLEKKPDNVLIYATSNRRHLIKEHFSDKDDRQGRYDEIHKSDTVEEKLSLSGRFGQTIYFSSPDKKEFMNIVKVLAEREGVLIKEDELYLMANEWELHHSGRSGRTARQFIDYLLSKK